MVTEVYPSDIQGLIALKPNYDEAYRCLDVEIIKSTPNNKQIIKGKTNSKRTYIGVGKCLVAFSCQYSIDKELEGFVELTSKSSKIPAIPSYVLSTSVARELLPKHYPKEDAIYYVSRYGLLVASLLTAKKAGVALGFKDALHQPYRQHLIPGFEQLVLMKGEIGVIGFVISGAGPTVLSLVEKEANQEKIMQTMRELMKVQGHTIRVQPLAVEGNGYSVQTIHSES